MRTPEKVIEYKGHKINIYQDTDTSDPEEWSEGECFITAYHRDFTVTNKLFSKEDCIAIARGEQKAKGYYTARIEAYIHGSVTLALSHEGDFPDRRWDVSQLGLVFVKRMKGTWTNEQARKVAKALLESWNQYLSGEVYGYMIETPDGDEEGGCWGYYGDPEKSGLIESAKDEIDDMIEADTKANQLVIDTKLTETEVY